MELKQDLTELVENLKNERDEILLKLHLASMDVKEEFENMEAKWDVVLQNCAELSDNAIETSDEIMAKAKLIGEEIKESYKRIRSIISD